MPEARQIILDTFAPLESPRPAGTPNSPGRTDEALPRSGIEPVEQSPENKPDI
jgi:hypothetical protein